MLLLLFSHWVVSDSLWPMVCGMPGFPVLHYLQEFAQNHVHWVGDAIEPSHPLLPPSLPALSVFHHEGLFQWVSSPYQVADWSFSFSISPFNEQSGLISFRIDWFDPHAVQGTLKHLLQHQNSKASVLPCSAFIVVQLSHLYLTTGKTIALTIQNCRESDVSCFWLCCLGLL